MNLVKTFFMYCGPQSVNETLFVAKSSRYVRSRTTLLYSESTHAESLKVHIHTYILLYCSAAFFYSLYLFSGYPKTTKYNEKWNLGK